MSGPAKTPSKRGRVTRALEHMRDEWQLYLMLAPTIIWLLVFLYTPMYGLQIAFKDYSIFRGVSGSPWVGFEHFYTLFENDQFTRALRLCATRFTSVSTACCSASRCRFCSR